MQELKTVDEFNVRIQSEQIIALFTADWCPDCRIIEPLLPEVEQVNSDYTFILIDRDQFMDICQQYDIFGIPSFIAFKNGEEIDRFVSKDRKTKEEITQFINRLP